MLATTPAPVELHSGLLRTRRAQGLLLFAATAMLLSLRLQLANAGPQPWALAILSAATMLVVVVLGADRAAVAAALAGAAGVILLPAGELAGLVVGSTALVAAAFAAWAAKLPLGLAGTCSLALLGELLTDTAGWLPLLGAEPGWRLAAAVLAAPLAIGVTAWAFGRLDAEVDTRWLLLLIFALGGSIDQHELLALALLVAARLALDAEQPRGLRALAWLALGSGVVVTPPFGLLALAYATARAHQVPGIAIALGAAGLGIVQHGAPQQSAVVLVIILCASALAQRLITALPADLTILLAGMWHGPLGLLPGIVRIAPRSEPWMFGIATLALITQTFPWARQDLDLAAVLGWRWPLAASLAIALMAAAVASRGKPHHRWAIVAVAWLIAAATHVGTPLIAAPRDLTVDTPALETETTGPQRGRVLVVDSQLAFAAGLEAGITVAEVEVRGEADQVVGVFALRAGVDTAEWAAASPGVAAPAGPRWISWIAPSQTSLGSRSRTRLALPDDTRVEAIRITRASTLPPRVLLTIHGVAVE